MEVIKLEFLIIPRFFAPNFEFFNQISFILDIVGKLLNSVSVSNGVFVFVWIIEVWKDPVKLAPCLETL